MITVYTTTNCPMYELRDSNCITVNKRASTKWIEEQYLVEKWQEQKDYFKKCFLAEHSTIETLHFRIIDDSCRGDVCNQMVRHTKGLPRYQVRSSRPDWTGEPRNLAIRLMYGFRHIGIHFHSYRCADKDFVFMHKKKHVNGCRLFYT